ncbi:MAG: mechanosensitive ion channel [Bacilli bacterium]|nr:mechanosensitive ion channel [Bacilli bacterium]
MKTNVHILDAYESWVEFWQKVGDFFIKPDSNGIPYIYRILTAVILIIIGWIFVKLVSMLLTRAFKINKKGPDIDVSAKYFIVQFIKIFLWLAIAFMVISVLKIDVTGAAGVISAVTVAIGLALQDLIGSFFSGLLLLQQKNIKTGEYIAVTNSYGTAEGTVDKIFFFFTHLRTPQGQMITIPNKNMTAATITNYSRIGKRRLDYDVGLAYDVDVELAKKVLFELIDNDEKVIKEDEKTVYIAKLDSYSVVFKIRCWTGVDNYWPLYNELGEKILITCRNNKLDIPSSTDINIKNRD